MGRFTGTVYKDTVNSVVSTVSQTLRNPYYPYIDKSPTVVDYWNINKRASTLDEGSLIEYSPYGDNSPIWYNYIKDFVIYGIQSTELNLINEEYGLQAEDISGEAVILPNTIVPMAGDYFTVNYIKEKLTYLVTEVQYDTFDNGANMYRLTYQSVQEPKEALKVFNRFRFIIQNVGTDFECIVQDEMYSSIEGIEESIAYLQQVFVDLFFNRRVQTFTFYHYHVPGNKNIYDPMLIEFIKRNKILSGVEPYIWVDHMTPNDDDFILRYNRCVFRAIELKKNDLYRYETKSQAFLITNPFTTFYCRPEEYYEMTYDPTLMSFGYISTIFDDAKANISEGTLFDLTREDYVPYNVIIKYLNDMTITEDDITFLKEFGFSKDNRYFYILPITIYCLNKVIDEMLTKKVNA